MSKPTPDVRKLDPKHDGQSLDLVRENIAALKSLFPEIVSDGKVDFEVLRTLLGDEVDVGDERYGLNWLGKHRARLIAQQPSTGTLRPCPEESVDWDTTQNLFIEGDNLEVLKLLQKAYHRRIKMIYIDPPYNTGKEFIYPDKYQDNLDTYLRYTGQKGEDGLKVGVNVETGGRYHTNWLNMMYPRLKLARNLLRDDGVIFVSIGDHEVHNLRHLLDEVLGAENFECHIHWRRRHNQPNDATKMVGLVAEHVLGYSRDAKAFKRAGVGKIGLTGKFSNPDNDPRGPWATKPWKSGSGQSGSRYEIKAPDGRVLDEEWMGEEATFRSLSADNRIFWTSGRSGLPRKKYFRSEREAEGQCATNWWNHDQFGNNQGATEHLASLFGVDQIFSNPKPVELISHLVQIAKVEADDVVLDFFAGSCTSFEAVLSEAGRCICVQLPEPLRPDEPEHRVAIDFCASESLEPTIASIAKERMRRSARLESHATAEDKGFKVFKLDSSNLKAWDGDPERFTNLTLDDAVNHIKPGRTDDDLLYELLLKLGLDLASPIERRDIQGAEVQVIGAGALVVCLQPKLGLEVIDGIAALKSELSPEVMRVVFRDACFADDVTKANAVQILRHAGVDDIQSL